MMLPRRKGPVLASETFGAKQASPFIGGGGGGGGGGRKSRKYSVFVTLISFILFVTFTYNEDVRSIAEFPFSRSRGAGDKSAGVVGELGVAVVDPIISDREVDAKVAAPEEVPASCDLFTGRWVYDEENYPIYKEAECEFLTEQVTCMRNGRRDDAYQKWRWQPQDCSLPRFNVRAMLERLRGKRLMFVGDSLNRNQWESMVCLVQAAVPPGKKTLTKTGSRNVFRLHDYNASVEFYWAPFLVESNSDDPNQHSILNRIIIPKSIAKHGQHWKNVDFLIFNTYIWWMNTLDMKVLQGSFDDGSTVYDEVERPVAYRRVLDTWANWVKKNVDPKRTMVFFMSMSPNHIKSEEWDNPAGIKCALETHPVGNLSHPLDVGTDWRLLEVAEAVLRRLNKKVPVSMVKITALSELRKDAHTSVHTLRQGKLLTPEQQADPATFADCIHWCLPGVPDVWNEFLYARIASAPWPHAQQRVYR